MRLAIGILLLASLLGAGVPGCQQDFEERVAAPPGGRLELDLDLGGGLRPDPGSVEIASREADEVRIAAEATGWGAEGVRVRLARDGETVRVDAGVSGALSWLFGGPHVRMRVWVPREFSADVRCSSGPIRIEDLRGEVRARTGDAGIEVSSVEGRVRLRAGSGGVRVSEVQGDVDVRLDDGDVEMSWIHGDVEVRTGSGGLELSHLDGRLSARTDRGSIELRDVDGPMEAKTERGSVFASFAGAPAGLLETRRGSVEVQIPEHAGAELEAVSGSGSVELAAGFHGPAAAGEGRVAGPLNGGGAPLRLYSARGSVLVRAR
jgi:hypothetical protein